MEKIITKGQIVFGLVIVAIGVLSFICAHFGLAIPGVPWVYEKPIFN